MKCVNFRAPGGASQLFIDELPEPTAGPGEIRVRVRAAGINRPDILQREGKYPPPKNASPILGLEVAGVVDQVGAGVAQWREGDSVCALVNGGGYAEAVTVPAGQVLPIPSGLTFAEAASLPETYFTVWANVFEIGQLRAGENFLVHGGSSGIGSAAIQLARAFGATVFTTVGNADKITYCRALGAEICINYREENYLEALKSRGVDLILDMVGGDYFEPNLRLLNPGGRLVHIAFLRGSKISADLMPVMLKRLTVTGSTLRPRSDAEKARLASELRTRVWPLFELKKVRPTLFREFPFSEVAAAHALMETGAHAGKIVLIISK